MKTTIIWQNRLDAAAPGLIDRCTLVATRPRSVILRGRSPEFGDVCVKYDPRRGGLARLRAEHAALSACHRADGRPFGVPRPCALVPDPQGGAALVTGWIDCPRADDRLARSLPFGGVRGGVLRRAAGWLAHFHGLGRVEERPLGAALDLAALEAELGAAAGEAEVPGRLREIVERDAGTPVRIATVHNDFLPQNLFLCPGQTVGIDFTLEVTGPALRDVGSFLANMVWRGYSTLDRKRAARFSADTELFLEAYYGGAAPPERRVARLFILSELTGKAGALAAKIARRRLGTSDRLHRMMIVGAIRHLLRCERA